MSDPRAIKNIFINEEAFSIGALSGTGTGTVWRGIPPLVFFRGTQSIIQATILMNDGTTPFHPPAGSTWLAGFDDTFTEDHPDLVVALNSQFIASDWNQANFADGMVCWRMDWTTQALKDALSNSPSLSGWMDLWMTPPGESPVLIAQWQTVVNNVAVDPTTATATPGITYPTMDVMLAALANITGPVGGLYRIQNGALQLYNSTTSDYQTVSLSGAVGSETVALGPHEA